MDEDYNVESLFHLKQMAEALEKQVALLERLKKNGDIELKRESKPKEGDKKALAESEKQTELAKKRKAQEERAARARIKALTVGKAQTRLLKEITNTVKTQLKADETLRGRGLTLEQVTAKFKDSVDALRGTQNDSDKSLVGYGLAQEAATRMYEVGFRTNNEALMRVAVAARVTHQNDKRMLKTLAANVAGSEMTNANLSELVGMTERLAEVYQVTASELIGAMEGMTDSMKTSDVLGLTEESMGVMQYVKALVGTEFTEVGSIFQGLTSVEGYSKALLMGVSAERERYLQGGPGAQEAGIQMMLKAAQFMVAKKDEWMATGHRRDMIGRDLGNIYGAEGIDLIRMQNQLNKRQREGFTPKAPEAIAQIKPRAEWTQTMAIFWSKVFDPLAEALNGLVAKLGGWLDSEAMKKWTQGAVAIAGLIGGAKAVKLVRTLGRGGATATKTIMRAMGFKNFGKKVVADVGEVTANRVGAVGAREALDQTGKRVFNANAWQAMMKKEFGYGGTAAMNKKVIAAMQKGMDQGFSERQLVRLFREQIIQNIPAGKIGPKAIQGITKELMEKFIGKKAANKIPFGIGMTFAAWFAGQAALQGEWKEAGKELASGALGISPDPYTTGAAVLVDANILKNQIDREYNEAYDKILRDTAMTEAEFVAHGGTPRAEVDYEFVVEALGQAFADALGSDRESNPYQYEPRGPGGGGPGEPQLIDTPGF